MASAVGTGGTSCRTDHNPGCGGVRICQPAAGEKGITAGDLSIGGWDSHIYRSNNVTWYVKKDDGAYKIDPPVIFEEDKEYRLSIELEPKLGYVFEDTGTLGVSQFDTFTLNGDSYFLSLPDCGVLSPDICQMQTDFIPAREPVIIRDVQVSGFVRPVAGEVSNPIDELSVPADAPYTISSVLFHVRKDDKYFSIKPPVIFEKGSEYKLDIRLRPKIGYVFEDTGGLYPSQFDTFTLDGSTGSLYLPDCGVFDPHFACMETLFFVAGLQPSYTVFFDTNGHSWFPGNVSVVEEGKTVTKPDFGNSTTDGWKFGGWYKEPSCINVFDFSEPVTGDMTLYAKWTGTHRVIFDTNGHGTAPAGQTVDDGKTATRPTTPYVPGLRFDGWYKEQSYINIYDFSEPVTEDIVLYAKWTGWHTVTFDANGHGTAPEPETAWGGETINSPTPDYVKGYSFGGWYTEKECIHRFNFDTPITCNITLYAKWSTTSTITYDANGGIKGPYWFDKYEVPADKTVTATVTEEPPDMFIKAPDGYVFCGFEIDGVIYRPGQTYTIMPVKDITFRYLWKSAAASDHVTVTYSGADYVPDPSVVETGSEYTVSDDRAISSGKVFRGWAAGDKEYGAGDRFIATENVVLVAMWYTPSIDPTGVSVINLNKALHGENPDQYPEYDMNGDGRVNIIDLVLMAQYVADKAAIGA